MITKLSENGIQNLLQKKDEYSIVQLIKEPKPFQNQGSLMKTEISDGYYVHKKVFFIGNAIPKISKLKQFMVLKVHSNTNQKERIILDDFTIVHETINTLIGNPIVYKKEEGFVLNQKGSRDIPLQQISKETQQSEPSKLLNPKTLFQDTDSSQEKEKKLNLPIQRTQTGENASNKTNSSHFINKLQTNLQSQDQFIYQENDQDSLFSFDNFISKAKFFKSTNQITRSTIQPSQGVGSVKKLVLSSDNNNQNDQQKPQPDNSNQNEQLIQHIEKPKPASLAKVQTNSFKIEEEKPVKTDVHNVMSIKNNAEQYADKVIPHTIIEPSTLMKTEGQGKNLQENQKQIKDEKIEKIYQNSLVMSKEIKELKEEKPKDEVKDVKNNIGENNNQLTNEAQIPQSNIKEQSGVHESAINSLKKRLQKLDSSKQKELEGQKSIEGFLSSSTQNQKNDQYFSMNNPQQHQATSVVKSSSDHHHPDPFNKVEQKAEQMRQLVIHKTSNKLLTKFINPSPQKEQQQSITQHKQIDLKNPIPIKKFQKGNQQKEESQMVNNQQVVSSESSRISNTKTDNNSPKTNNNNNQAISLNLNKDQRDKLNIIEQMKKNSKISSAMKIDLIQTQETQSEIYVHNKQSNDIKYKVGNNNESPINNQAVKQEPVREVGKVRSLNSIPYPKPINDVLINNERKSKSENDLKKENEQRQNKSDLKQQLINEVNLISTNTSNIKNDNDDHANKLVDQNQQNNSNNKDSLEIEKNVNVQSDNQQNSICKKSFRKVKFSPFKQDTEEEMEQEFLFSDENKDSLSQFTSFQKVSDLISSQKQKEELLVNNSEKQQDENKLDQIETNIKIKQQDNIIEQQPIFSKKCSKIKEKDEKNKEREWKYLFQAIEEDYNETEESSNKSEKQTLICPEKESNLINNSSPSKKIKTDVPSSTNIPDDKQCSMDTLQNNNTNVNANILEEEKIQIEQEQLPNRNQNQNDKIELTTNIENELTTNNENEQKQIITESSTIEQSSTTCKGNNTNNEQIEIEELQQNNSLLEKSNDLSAIQSKDKEPQNYVDLKSQESIKTQQDVNQENENNNISLEIPNNFEEINKDTIQPEKMTIIEESDENIGGISLNFNNQNQTVIVDKSSIQSQMKSEKINNENLNSSQNNLSDHSKRKMTDHSELNENSQNQQLTKSQIIDLEENNDEGDSDQLVDINFDIDQSCEEDVRRTKSHTNDETMNEEIEIKQTEPKKQKKDKDSKIKKQKQEENNQQNIKSQKGDKKAKDNSQTMSDENDKHNKLQQQQVKESQKTLLNFNFTKVPSNNTNNQTPSQEKSTIKSTQEEILKKEEANNTGGVRTLLNIRKQFKMPTLKSDSGQNSSAEEKLKPTEILKKSPLLSKVIKKDEQNKQPLKGNSLNKDTILKKFPSNNNNNTTPKKANQNIIETDTKQNQTVDPKKHSILKKSTHEDIDLLYDSEVKQIQKTPTSKVQSNEMDQVYDKMISEHEKVVVIENEITKNYYVPSNSPSIQNSLVSIESQEKQSQNNDEQKRKRRRYMKLAEIPIQQNFIESPIEIDKKESRRGRPKSNSNHKKSTKNENKTTPKKTEIANDQDLSDDKYDYINQFMYTSSNSKNKTKSDSDKKQKAQEKQTKRKSINIEIEDNNDDEKIEEFIDLSFNQEYIEIEDD